MSVSYERRNASRVSDRIGTLLIIFGCLGIAAGVVCSVWAIHDLRGQTSIPLSTVDTMEVVMQIGAIPVLLSLLVVACGVFFQSRSTELLFGTLVTNSTVEDWDESDDEDTDD